MRQTYLTYLYYKLKTLWKQDKLYLFFVLWLFSVFASIPSLFLIVSDVWFPIRIVAFIIVGYMFVFGFILTFPMFLNWQDNLYYIIQILLVPYKLTRWAFHCLQDTYYSYKVWKGWQRKCCFNCIKCQDCERTHPATKTCEGYEKNDITQIRQDEVK